MTVALSTNWIFNDNLLDAADLVNYTDALVHDYNAFYDSAGFWTNCAAHEQILTNLTYEAGLLGLYYQPTNSVLIDAGSCNATNVGLYHFTATIDQAKEGNSTTDIGFHYVALDGSGLPIDGDGDGLPDYLEDKNGNGTVDAGETDWEEYDSMLGIGSGPGLVVFTPLE